MNTGNERPDNHLIRANIPDGVAAERQRLNDVLEMLPAYVVLLKPDYHVGYANRFFKERFGEGGNLRCYEFLFQRTEPCEICETYRVLKTGKPHQWEWRGPDGHTYEVRDFPFTDSDGSQVILEMGHDITELKEAHDEIKRHRDELEALVTERTRELGASESRLRSLFASMTEGSASHEIVYERGQAVDYIITDVNPAYERITGHSRSEVVGRRATQAYGVPNAPYLEIYARVAASGVPETFETYFPPMDKNFSISVFSPEQGMFATIFADISERARAQAEQARLASFPELNPNPIFELDNAGAVSYMNAAARALFPDLLVATFMHPVMAGLEQLIPKSAAAEVGSPSTREVNAEGRHYHETVVYFPELGRTRVYCIDITERKQAEEALLAAALQKRASEYTRTLIEVSLDPLVTISPDGQITDVNEATVTATGVPREELIGASFSAYFTEPEQAERGYKRVFAEGFVKDYPLTIRHRDGRTMDVLYNASLYKDADGKVLGTFAAARDVTEQRKAEAERRRHREDLERLVQERTAELEESNRELARSNENLQQFAYVASHDLQEPLRIMSSYSQLLEKRYKEKLDADADEFITFIVDAAARMQRLITDLLAYSRAGHATVDLVEVDCNDVLRRLILGMSRTIEAADACVTFDKLPSIQAHEGELTQLFQNLIGNALKFRTEASPYIHISARRAGAEWVFSVQDNGIGIEPQYRERIFLIFQRLHSREKFPGTGIGLSICRKIVENLGGRIWVESQPGQGSTFYFTVPVRETEAAYAEPAA